MENIENAIAALKECVAFLIEQEELRGKAVAAQQEEIEGLKTLISEHVIKPMYEAHYEDELEDFQNKYGERLGKFDKVLGRIQDDPAMRENYSTAKETFDDYFNNEMQKPEDDRMSMDEYVAQVEQQATELLQDLKASMGLPEDTAIEMSQDADGNTSIKVDENGDGKPETEVAEGTDAESSEEEKESEDENAEPTEEEINAYLKGEDTK